jgi:hypothetical protein
MFCKSFEKIAINTSTIASKFSKTISGAMKPLGGVATPAGRAAGNSAVRAIESHSAQLASKGSITSAGQRTDALRSLVPKSEKPAGNTLNYATMKMNNPAPVSTPKPPATAKPDVFKQNSDRMLRRNTGYSEVK